MRALWFTSGASLLTENKSPDSIGCAWVNSLQREIQQNDITLGIAFLSSNTSTEIVKKDTTTYYLMPGFHYNTKFTRLLRKWMNLIENEKHVVKHCMDVIRDFKPDIIQFFGSENPCGLVMQYTSVPSILHIQGILTICYYNYFSAFSKKEIRRAAGIMDWMKRNPPFYHWKLYEKHSLIEKKILAHCKSFFGRTDWDRRIINIFSPNSNYYYCNEIMRDEFYQTEWKADNSDVFTIISVFQDDIYKGLETIYDTAFLLQEMNFAFVWKIAGVAEDSRVKRIVMKNRCYAVNELPVRQLGKLSSNKLVEELLTSKLFIHASHVENSSNSVSEAMLLGMPVLSTNVGGLQSLIENGENGYMVQDGDPWAMAGAIKEIHDNYKKAIEAGKNARITALNRHDKQKIVETVLTTYKTIINNA